MPCTTCGKNIVKKTNRGSFGFSFSRTATTTIKPNPVKKTTKTKPTQFKMNF